MIKINNFDHLTIFLRPKQGRAALKVLFTLLLLHGELVYAMMPAAARPIAMNPQAVDPIGAAGVAAVGVGDQQVHPRLVAQAEGVIAEDAAAMMDRHENVDQNVEPNRVQQTIGVLLTAGQVYGGGAILQYFMRHHPWLIVSGVALTPVAIYHGMSAVANFFPNHLVANGFAAHRDSLMADFHDYRADLLHRASRTLTRLGQKATETARGYQVRREAAEERGILQSVITDSSGKKFTTCLTAPEQRRTAVYCLAPDKAAAWLEYHYDYNPLSTRLREIAHLNMNRDPGYYKTVRMICAETVREGVNNATHAVGRGITYIPRQISNGLRKTVRR